MGLMNQMLQIVYYIIYALIGMIVLGGVLFFVRKKQKKRSTNDYDSTNYSNLSRGDSKDYIKIDDIVDNVIVTDHWKRFIGVIDCAGFDLYALSEQEQLNTMKNYMPFINTIDQPMTYRQYCRPADMEDAILNYKEAQKKVESQLKEVGLQLEELSKLCTTSTSKEEITFYEKRITEYIKQWEVLEFRKLHIVDQINYMEQCSGNHVAPLLTQTYVFEWSVDKLDSIDFMTKEDIFMKAKVELDTIATSKIHALRTSGVKARRCTTEELIDMCRHHSLPVSCERFKKRDLSSIEFSADIITSEDLKKYQFLINEQKKSCLSKEKEVLLSSIIEETSNIVSKESENVVRNG